LEASIQNPKKVAAAKDNTLAIANDSVNILQAAKYDQIAQSPQKRAVYVNDYVDASQNNSLLKKSIDDPSQQNSLRQQSVNTQVLPDNKSEGINFSK